VGGSEFVRIGGEGVVLIRMVGGQYGGDGRKDGVISRAGGFRPGRRRWRGRRAAAPRVQVLPCGMN